MGSLSFGNGGDGLVGEIDRQSAALHEEAPVCLEPTRAAGAREEAFRYDNIRLLAGSGQCALFNLPPSSSEQ
jgi:hypothetical protein